MLEHHEPAKSEQRTYLGGIAMSVLGDGMRT
jgi:hypothetical protein